MSKYLEDIQGRIESNPINETNTEYPYIESHDASESKIYYQYMYNHNEPVSDIDTQYYDSYRSKVEELRTKTESMNEALESCLVPVEIHGMAFQPYEFRKEETEDGEETYEKIKSPVYFFQDHTCMIGQGRSISTNYESKEFVFRTNKVKFIDDRKRRLIYDRTIHLMGLKEDEVYMTPFKEVIRRTFYTKWNNRDYCLIRDIYGTKVEINIILQAILDNANKIGQKLVVLTDDDGRMKTVEDISDFDYVLESGQDVDTGIPSTVYNLYNIGWIHPSMIFMNSLAIDWTKIVISVDNIDTFVIISNLRNTLSEYIDDAKPITMEYVHIPFKVAYIISTENTDDSPYSQYYNKQTGEFDMPIFIINKTNGAMIKGEDEYKKKQISLDCDRVICVDPNIKFAEFYLSSDEKENFENYLPDIGIQFTQSFRDFCDNDYRCKLKQFNFLGFEVNKKLNDKYNSNDLLTYKNNDFNVTWHPFNIIDIRFKNLYNQKRLFKVFYNTKVLYDQDNILRIRNHKYLADEYEKYRQDVTANIETYIREIYIMAKKDIGVYIATNGVLKGYKYRYVTPYECFMLYNALQTSDLGNGSLVTFDEFRNLNVLFPPGETSIGYINGGFMIFDDKHDYFDGIVKESTIYEEGTTVVKSEIKDFWNKFSYAPIMDVLVPIDDESFISSSDSRGKIVPHPLWLATSDNVTSLGLVQENTELEYDYLKLRFEMTYLNNMEEGATPVDEFIYYFDDNNGKSIVRNSYPVMSVEDCDNRYTANLLNSLAYNVFKADPHLVLDSIKKMNYSASYIIPNSLGSLKRENCITSISSEPPTDGYDYRRDPRYFYNYGIYIDDDIKKPKMLQSEWALRRNLPEMFYFSLEKDQYTIDSMHLLDEVFDFTYGFDKSYEQNLKDGTEYIIGYDADKLEASIKRSIVSITRSGKELKEYKIGNVASKDYTLDRYKMITFVTNNNYKIVFDNIRIYAIVNDDGTVDFNYVNEDGVLIKNFYVASMRYRTQENYTVTKTGTMFTDVDKGFSATFSAMKTKFDYDNGIAEFYDANDNLVVTLQVDRVYDNRKLEMSRWNISQQYNYVMIFKNNMLYENYKSIEYTDISFKVDFVNSEIADDDMFEFVFFLNANNNIISKSYKNADELKLTIPSNYYSYSGNPMRVDANDDNMDKGLYQNMTGEYTFDSAISCNTTLIDAENVQLLVDKMPKADGDQYEVPNTMNTAYELSYKLYSYQAKVDPAMNPDRRRYIHSICEDNKINGLHRVTKQGGGEYFIEFDGKVTNPDTDDIMAGEYSTDRTINPPYTIYISSKRQFRYSHIDITENHEAGYIYKMNNDFRFCIHNSHLMVFKNGLILPPTYYFLHSIVNTPIYDVGVVFNVSLEAGDSIDIFYVTNDLKHLETDFYAPKERYVQNGLILSNINDVEYRVMGEQLYENDDRRTNYIKLRSPLYAISSKHSTFIFLNGKKIRLDELEDISDTIIGINSDYSDREDMNAIRLEVINHLDTQDIIEQLYINDGLSHDDSVVTDAFSATNSPNAYKNTKTINSFSLKELDTYAERTLLDEILNDLSSENLNKLFYEYSTGKGPMTHYKFEAMKEPDFIDEDKIKESIIEEYYTSEVISENPADYIRDTQVGLYSNTILYIGDADKIRVPKIMDDEEVKTLYATTFNNNTFLTKVIIPEGVETID